MINPLEFSGISHRSGPILIARLLFISNKTAQNADLIVVPFPRERYIFKCLMLPQQKWNLQERLFLIDMHVQFCMLDEIKVKDEIVSKIYLPLTFVSKNLFG